MGGYNSGRRSNMPTVGESLRIELPHLKDRGFLGGNGESGTWSWSCCGEPSGVIRLMVRLNDDLTGRLILDYKRSGVTKHNVIYLEAVPMRFGGVRWWAICPISGKRCGTLVMCERYDGFVSVKVAGYAYMSQNEGELDRLASKRDKAQKRYEGLSKYTRLPRRDRLLADYYRLIRLWDERFYFYAEKILQKCGGLEY